MNCTVIDMKKTGELLKATIHDAGYDIKFIQEHLQLACPSAIYRWYKGKILPSLDHLYSLSVLLDMHMEDLIVQKNFHLCGWNHDYDLIFSELHSFRSF